MNTKTTFETFGNYVLLQKLAEGGMAEVHLARPANLDANGRVLVVKRILPHIASHSYFLKMFQREIRLIMGFNHPHVVQLHDFGTVNGQPFIAMEYVEGKSLRDIMAKLQVKKHPMPVPMALSLANQAAAGLNYAHSFVNKVTGEELHAVHRDISPHNLIVSYEGNLKVIDFGIAKCATSLENMTQTGVIKGKAAYFSPEQCTGGTVDERTDIFALGTVAWELLTGQRLFARAGDTEVTAMSRVTNCEQHVIAPSKVNKEVPFEVDEVIMTALEKNPDERYQTAKDFQVALRQAMLHHYPNYSYSDTGTILAMLFNEEIVAERVKLRELNLEAQRNLMGTPSDKTTSITYSPNGVAAASHNINTNTASGAYEVSNGTGVGVVDFRLSKIEAMMKQKATGRHWVLFAFYVVSLFALKISDRFDFNIDISAQETAVAAPLPKAVNQPASVLPQGTPQVQAAAQRQKALQEYYQAAQQQQRRQVQKTALKGRAPATTRSNQMRKPVSVNSATPAKGKKAVKR